ncbi:MAG: nuclear protein, partial [Piptocephalis tieghemiana]
QGRRQRSGRACDTCRRRKVRCDGESPVCSNCKSVQASCTYNDTARKRGPPKGYIEAIELRLQRMESLIEN